MKTNNKLIHLRKSWEQKKIKLLQFEFLRRKK